MLVLVVMECIDVVHVLNVSIMIYWLCVRLVVEPKFSIQGQIIIGAVWISGLIRAHHLMTIWNSHLSLYYLVSYTSCVPIQVIIVHSQRELMKNFFFSQPTKWGTWKAGVSLLNTGIRHPGSVMKNVIPIVMAGVIGIYGLIIAVILGGNIPSPTVGTGENIYSIYTGMAHVSVGWRSFLFPLF